jgi:hypothetical protein
MASKIKADQFETLDGSGNITLNNSVTMASTKTLPAASLTGALPAISGASLTGLTATNLGSGTVPTARLGSGTASSSTFLRGDGSWQAAGSTSASDLTSGTLPIARIADDAITLAKMAPGTDGNIISYDASGNPVAIATGNDGQVLTSAGAGAPPAFESISSGGKVLQVVTATLTSRNSFSGGTTFLDSGLSAAITPSATSSKILVSADITTGTSGSAYGVGLRLLRGSTVMLQADSQTGRMRAHSINCHGSNAHDCVTTHLQHLDSPSTTSATTYKIQGGARDQKTWSINQPYNNDDSSTWYRAVGCSTIVLMEIEG